MSSVFTGSGVALVTPFSEDGKIDYNVFEKLIEFQIANNTDAIIVCGTTGEGSTLTVDERLSLFRFAADKIKGRVPLVCGTGSNSTSFSFEVASQAEKCGADAHLMVTPYYNKTSQKGLVKHYFYLADRLDKPLIVYNVPSSASARAARSADSPRSSRGTWSRTSSSPVPVRTSSIATMRRSANGASTPRSRRASWNSCSRRAFA